MATPEAISTTAITIQQLLRAAWNENPPRAATASLAGTTEISLLPFSDLAKPEPKPCLTISIHGITVNTSARNTPPRPPATDEHPAQPVILDVHFLIAAWSKPTTTAIDQRLIDQLSFIGWAAHAMTSLSVLPASVLNPYNHIPGMTNSPFRHLRATGAQSVFADDESVELMVENLPATELSAIWNAARTTPQPSLTFIARGLRIG